MHSTLGPGFLESVYQHALADDLRRLGLTVQCQGKLRVVYNGVVVGEFSPDMLVEGRIIVENKAVRKIGVAHEVQLVNYLTATGTDIGLLLNFGAERLQFRRKVRSYASRTA